jgi:hypothetical protein
MPVGNGPARLAPYNPPMRHALIFVAVLIPAVARTQDRPCSALKSEVTIGPLSGHRIDSVLVETANPRLGRLGRLVGKMHVRTRPDVIRRELLFAPGDTVDTLQVAESLRRLRKLPFLEYASVEASECPGQSGATLVLDVVTRDSWTTRPDIKASKRSPRIGLTERSLFGTGRTASLELVSRNRKLGAGITAFDPFGFGTGVMTRAEYQRYSDGRILALSLARRQASVTDRWIGELDLYDQRHEPRTPLADNFERTGGEAIGGLRITPRRDAHAVYLLAGVESEYSSLVAAPNADIVGPVRVERRFTGPQVGVSILSARYDTLTWLLSGGSVVDVPRTLEGEIVVGVGSGAVTVRDFNGASDTNSTANFMTHYDGWVGREWLPTRGSRIVTDLWASGYSRAGEWQSSRLRAAISAEHAASNGLWRLTIAQEQLNDPDPDVRALGIYDRALAFVPSRIRLAESALSVSIERTRHIRSVGSSLELDGSLFGALSKRWDPAPSSSSAEDFTVGVAGLGLSLSPRRPGRGTVRLDYGFPLTGTPGIRRTPRFSLTIFPWLESSRHREKSGLF